MCKWQLQSKLLGHHSVGLANLEIVISFFKPGRAPGSLYMGGKHWINNEIDCIHYVHACLLYKSMGKYKCTQAYVVVYTWFTRKD